VKPLDIMAGGYTGPMIAAALLSGPQREPGAVILIGRAMNMENKLFVRVRHELLPSEADDLANQLRAMAASARQKRL
jgi:hypothetical protein